MTRGSSAMRGSPARWWLLRAFIHTNVKTCAYHGEKFGCLRSSDCAIDDQTPEPNPVAYFFNLAISGGTSKTSKKEIRDATELEKMRKKRRALGNN